ncbi:hypothetical protein GCM10025867_41710 [Frondihabitans sucicola]|uniref:Transcriptional regulator LacI/GalR-like sensor domain-containing protein n=1 Tax=Frondihabitans sucicola TaxID=1268041 RepID=A0ABM8GTY3_9MICO|nr:substrate-binding domain-containing protein [Frondihabitans sucicola]BDZ51930.1 hypothetical protein GCM10025867_41710 [Frondihabitans sucicola]
MRAAVDALLGQNVEAIVLIAPDSGAIEAVQAVDIRVPLVTADSTAHDGLVSVSLDQFSGAVLATEHLASLGHTSIVHVGGPAEWTDARERERGWRSALDSLGLESPAVLRGDWTPESGYRIGLELAESPDLTAVFCANDQMALGVLHAFAERRIEVPARVSITGFDDVPEAAHYFPPLTTVRQDFSALGRQIMATVESLLAGGAADVGRVAAPTLVVRSSTARRRS